MHVIVIGAGIAGLSTAWSLVRRGVRVTLVEQSDTIPNPLSASGDQHRIIRRAYGGLGGYQRRIDEAYAAWNAMWDDLGENHLVDTGFLLVSQAPGDEADVYHRGLEEAGYPVEALTPEEAAARYPFLDAGTIRRVGFGPEGGVLLCRRIAAGLLAWLESHDVEIVTGRKAVRTDARSAMVRLDDEAELAADHLVLTAGAWTLGLLPELDATLTPYRTAVAYLSPPADLMGAWEAAPAILDVGGRVDGYIVPPVADTGLKVGAGCHKRLSAPDSDRVPAENEGVTIRDYFAPPLARIDEYSVADVKTCAYTFTRDEHFFVRASCRMTVVSACSGHGYKFGAAVGRRIADGIVDDRLEAARAWIEARD